MVKLNKIYTKTGDDGTTGLVRGPRRLKYDLRVNCFGTVDEANAAIGVARLSSSAMPKIDAVLGRIQNDLFDLGSDLATPGADPEGTPPSLRITPAQTLWHVLLPQAFVVALPPMTNDFVALLKDSSLISVITVIELTKRMTIAAVDMHGWLIPGLACAALYLALSFPLAELARRLERRLARDQRPRTL